MRDKIWRLILKNYPEEMVLNRWRVVAHCILFPLYSFYWFMGNSTGYQPLSNRWLIHGVEFSNEALRRLAKADGETYTVISDGKYVTLVRVYDKRESHA